MGIYIGCGPSEYGPTIEERKWEEIIDSFTLYLSRGKLTLSGLSAYGLKVEKGATKAFQLVIQVSPSFVVRSWDEYPILQAFSLLPILFGFFDQAYILKHLMFEGRGRKAGAR